MAVLVEATNPLFAAPPMNAVRAVASAYQVGIDKKTLESVGVPGNGSLSDTGNPTLSSSTIVARPIALTGRTLFKPT